MEGTVLDQSEASLADLIYDYTYNPAMQMDRKELKDNILYSIAALDDKDKAIIIRPIVTIRRQ